MDEGWDGAARAGHHRQLAASGQRSPEVVADTPMRRALVSGVRCAHGLCAGTKAFSASRSLISRKSSVHAPRAAEGDEACSDNEACSRVTRRTKGGGGAREVETVSGDERRHGLARRAGDQRTRPRYFSCFAYHDSALNFLPILGYNSYNTHKPVTRTCKEHDP